MKAKGCRCCVVAADPMEPDVAIVYEEWATEDDLLAFRGQAAAPDMRRMIAGADVRRHHAARSEPA